HLKALVEAKPWGEGAEAKTVDASPTPSVEPHAPGAAGQESSNASVNLKSDTAVTERVRGDDASRDISAVPKPVREDGDREEVPAPRAPMARIRSFPCLSAIEALRIVELTERIKAREKKRSAPALELMLRRIIPKDEAFLGEAFGRKNQIVLALRIFDIDGD